MPCAVRARGPLVERYVHRLSLNLAVLILRTACPNSQVGGAGAVRSQSGGGTQTGTCFKCGEEGHWSNGACRPRLAIRAIDRRLPQLAPMRLAGAVVVGAGGDADVERRAGLRAQARARSRNVGGVVVKARGGGRASRAARGSSALWRTFISECAASGDDISGHGPLLCVPLVILLGPVSYCISFPSGLVMLLYVFFD